MARDLQYSVGKGRSGRGKTVDRHVDPNDRNQVAIMDSEKPTGTRGGDKAAGGISARRRRLLKGTVAATPLLLTAVSRPVLGGGVCTPSGFLSGNLSHATHHVTCGGRSPGYWKKNCPHHHRNRLFRDIFGGNWRDVHGDEWTPDPTLFTVLWMTGSEDLYEFGAHAVAAWLNAVQLSDYVMREDEVWEVVNQVIHKLMYTDPVSGRTMDAEETVYFFSGTFDI